MTAPDRPGPGRRSSVPDALVAALGLDVFERRADGAFVRLGAPPAWAEGAFPEADGAVDLRASAVLDGFLDDAAWDADAPAASGAFAEPGADGQTRTLEARALRLDGRRLVLVGPPTVGLDATQRVLQAARDQALAADAERRRAAERETLLHCIVHDLSNPLAGLRGSLQLLGEDAEGDDAELAAIGLRAADRMQATIRSVLDAFAASVDPLLPTAEAPRADLAGAIRRAADAAGPGARTAGVALDVDVPPGGLLVVGEAGRLERAVANLVANAIRHAEGAVRVGLSHGDAWATASVRDDGPGIDAELRPRLFRPLVQGAGGGAVGLGLHSVRLAAEAWGGAAGETPGEGLGAGGRGAHVWLRLPRA